jgi:hypothetical protein
MKPLSLLALIGATMCLNSCSVAKSLIQIPLRTLQTVGRSVGAGIEYSEIEGQDANKMPVKESAEFSAR